jgi:hypothetical protein
LHALGDADTIRALRALAPERHRHREPDSITDVLVGL